MEYLSWNNYYRNLCWDFKYNLIFSWRVIRFLEICKFLFYEFIWISVTTECCLILVIISQCENVYFSIKSFALTINVFFLVRFYASVVLGRAENEFTSKNSPSSSVHVSECMSSAKNSWLPLCAGYNSAGSMDKPVHSRTR